MRTKLLSLLAVCCLLPMAGCEMSPAVSESSDFADITLRVEESSIETEATTVLQTDVTETQSLTVTDSMTYDVTEVTVPQEEDEEIALGVTEVAEAVIDRDGTYTSKEDVALYIYTYGELPQNFITKKEAEALGWKGGSLEPYAAGKCIGGTYFGNYEGHLPEKKGRKYTECDIDTLGKSSRGAKRIVFSNDGLIYYTEDHYNTFTLLYGEELS